MLPEIIDGQSVFIEITNFVHGGQGWELGELVYGVRFMEEVGAENHGELWNKSMMAI